MVTKPTKRASDVSLHVKQLGSGPPVLLLHGLFGTGSNLGALARALQDTYSVHSLDLPGHGRSERLAENTLPAMAEAVLAYMRTAGIERAALVGHSLGGKVAMQVALQAPERVAAVVVADIAPVAYAPSHQPVFEALQAVTEAAVVDRQSAREILQGHLREPGVVDFLLLSLYRNSDGSWCWRFDCQGLRQDYAALLAAPRGDAPFAGPTLFIAGGDSDYVTPAYYTAMSRWFVNHSVITMPGCGHWLHAQQPQMFNARVSEFLLPYAGSGASLAAGDA